MQLEADKLTRNEMTEESYFHCACKRIPALKYVNHQI